MPQSADDADLPLVLQVGFSGSRTFLSPERASQIDQVTFEREIEDYLFERLSGLKEELGLTKPRFVCGICQLAAGGDTLFVRACRRLEAPVRIFLPQPSDLFFQAKGDEADFTPEQRSEGEAILASQDVVQVRVIGEAASRSARFQAVNHEIARVSDVSICLVRANAEYNQGGALEFIEQAQVRRRPVLKIIVTEAAGQPTFTAEWIDKDRFVPPEPPHSLSHAALSESSRLERIPTIASYVERLRADCRTGATRARDRFTTFASVIIGTHIAATMLALIALAVHHPFPSLALPLLLTELTCLGIGFGAHKLMHQWHVTKNWAEQRLVLQLASSVEGVAGNHSPLDYLFQLSIPPGFRPLLRTLNVLHLCDSSENRASSAVDLEARRQRYLDLRVHQQRKYYRDRLHLDRRWLRFFQYAFTIFSGLAFLATSAEFGITVWEWANKSETQAAVHSPHSANGLLAESKHSSSGETPATEKSGQEEVPPGEHTATTTDFLTSRLGELAVLLPVLAVGMMSIAAAHDLEGRLHTYAEIIDFLTTQGAALQAARTNDDFSRLIAETESRLLGETTNWLSRRSFTGVA